MYKCKNETILPDEIRRLFEGNKQLQKAIEYILEKIAVPTSMPRPFTKMEGCDFLQISQRTMDKILQSGELKSFRIQGNHIRIMPEDIKAYINSNQSSSPETCQN